MFACLTFQIITDIQIVGWKHVIIFMVLPFIETIPSNRNVHQKCLTIFIQCIVTYRHLVSIHQNKGNDFVLIKVKLCAYVGKVTNS